MELTTKAISELCKDYYFNIPAYQRGYRWDNQLSLPVLNFLRKSLAGIEKLKYSIGNDMILRHNKLKDRIEIAESFCNEILKIDS